MITYVKLGEKAQSFSDPMSGVNLSGKEVVSLTSSDRNSPKLRKAIIGGHIIRCSKIEYEAFQKTVVKSVVLDAKTSSMDNKKLIDRIQELENANNFQKMQIEELMNPETDLDKQINEDGMVVKEFSEMDSGELIDYYKENYEITEKQEKEFKKLDLPGMIKALEALEA